MAAGASIIVPSRWALNKKNLRLNPRLGIKGGQMHNAFGRLLTYSTGRRAGPFLLLAASVRMRGKREKGFALH